MTEQELQAIEAAAFAADGHPVNMQPHETKGLAAQALALVAEARRLRAALEAADAHMRRWSDARSGSSAETHAACEAWAVITKALAVSP